MRRKTGHIDWYILLSVAGLMLFSIAFVYSASASYAEIKFGDKEALFWNHAVRIFLGLITIIIFAKIDYHIYEKISKLFIIAAVFLLILVLFAGFQAKGASRWLDLGALRFQPSEFAKYALVLHLAVVLTKNQEIIKDFKEGLVPLLLWSGLIAFLILLQPNHSTALVILVIAILMMFVGNTNILHLSGISAVALVVFGAYAAASKYPVQRIMAFIGSGEGGGAAESFNYQLEQSLIAFGNGGIFGVGPGQSGQSHHFLPESYGDFIFSIIGEEYGYLGIILIVGLFILICWRGVLIAKKAPDPFGYYLSFGILITILIYAFVNASVNCGLLPTTGLPMPFISYGGTAVFFHAASVGILLNISAQAGVYPRKDTHPVEKMLE